MPSQSIADLKKAIESAPEMTAEHRAKMLELVTSLANEVATAEEAREGAEADEGAENLRGAIAVAEAVVRQRGGSDESGGEHELAERIAELEDRAEMVALEHPVIANVLAAIARLI